MMRGLKPLALLVLLLVLPHAAKAQSQGSACLTVGVTTTPDATGNNLICNSSKIWQYPAYILGSTGSGGSAATCASGTTGAIEWTGSAFQGCNGTSWGSLGGASTITLSGDVTGSGTTAITTSVAAIEGTTVSGTTGTTNVVFSASPTVTGTLTGATSTWSGTASFYGASSVPAAVVTNAAEPVTVSATAATGTINFYLASQSVLYYTTAASASWIVNFAMSSGTTMNSALAVGQSITAVFLVTQGTTAFFNSAVKVDGTATGVTTLWQGGTAPAAGYASGVDVYQYTIIKTASATYTVLASQVRY
jgi:hypothetical protein